MSSGDKPLVQLIGIGKRYGTGPTAFDALHHVDLSINAGEFVAISGPSGSRKIDDDEHHRCFGYADTRAVFIQRFPRRTLYA